MENNTFFNNNPRRFVVCDSLKISNTVFQDSTESNSFIGQHTSSISNCSFREFNCLAQIPPITCGPNILTGIDPLFVNPDSGDFRLQPCSPLINAGSNVFLSADDTTDLAGLPRVRGGTVDIGAYEAQGPSLAAAPLASPSCPGGASGALDLAVQDACPPLAYAWQSGTASGASLSGLPAGDYQFTLTDAKGQQLVFSAAVPQGSGPTLVGATTPVVCGDTLGGSAAAGLNAGALPFSYTWAGSASTDSLRSGLAAGSYAVTVTDARGCSAAGTVTVDKTGNLGVDIDVADISCPGAADGGLTVLPANGKAPFTWHWSGGANTPTLAPLGPGTYLGALTDALNCTIGWILPLGEPEALQANPLVGNASDSMALNGRIELQPSGGTAPYAALWSTGAAGLSIDSLAAGWYTLTLTDAHDCTLVETVAVGVASATGAPGSEAPGFTLTPNPAAAAVWLLLTQPAATDWPVRLYNTSGQLVREIRLPAGAERFRLTTADWPRGVYFVQVAGRMEKLVLE